MTLRFLIQYEIFGLDLLGNSNHSITVSMCVVYEHVCKGDVCLCARAVAREEYQCLLLSLFTLFLCRVSLSLELGWKPASPSNLPIFNYLSAGDHILVLCGC